MAFTTIPSTWIAVGKALKQSLFQYIKDNFDAHETSLSQITSGVVPNGSFENVDAEGYPLSWTWAGYSGGTRGSETTSPAHGSRGIWITSPGGSGNGGGYYESDYTPCSPQALILFQWFHKSSVAGIHNLVELLWYDSAKAYLSLTVIYDSAANPTSWTRVIAGALPPATAMFVKVRVTGAKSDNTTAGTAYFDGVEKILSHALQAARTIAENSNSTDTWADKGSFDIDLGNLPNPTTVVIHLVASLRSSSSGVNVGQRFRAGAWYSNAISTGLTGYSVFPYTIIIPDSLGGKITVFQQLLGNTFDPAIAYGKKDMSGTAIIVAGL